MRRFQRGDIFDPTAQEVNAWQRAAERASSFRTGDRPRPSRGGGSEVLIKNDSGADVDRFGILGIDGPLITPADNLDEFKHVVTFSGITPASEHAHRFCITREPIASGKIGRGIVDGITPIQVDIKDTGDAFASVIDGDASKLESNSSGGVRILDSPTSTGVQWAYVELDSSGGSGQELLPFRLTTKWTDGQAKAKRLLWPNTTSNYTVDTTEVDVFAPSYILGGDPPGLVGDTIWLTKATSSLWELVSAPTHHWVMLDGALEAGGSATADSNAVTVHEKVLKSGCQIKSGLTIPIQHDHADKKWYPVWQLTDWRAPWRIRAITSTAVDVTDTYFSVTSVSEIAPYCLEFTTSGAPTTISNTHGFAFDASTVIWAEYDGSGGYDVLQGPCPA